MKNIHPDLLQASSYAWLILALYWLFASMRTKITVKKDSSSSRIVHVLMLAAAFALIYDNRLAIGFLKDRFLPNSDAIAWIGFVANIAGILFAITARSWLGTNWSGAVTVKKDHELIRTGPYAITRHPIYTGLFFAIVGSAMMLGQWRGVTGIILFLIAINRKIAVEEKFMETTFGEYREYKNHTPKLIPFIY